MAEETLTKSELKLDPSQKTQGRRQGAGRVRDRPDAQGGRRGQEGRDGDRADRGRLGQGRRAGPRGPDRDRRRQGAAREAAHARPGVADRRDARGQDLEPDPGAERDRPAGTPIDIFFEDPTSAEQNARRRARTARTKAGGRRWRGRRRRRWRRAARRSPSRRSASDDVEKYAKKAADLGIVPKTTRRFDDAPVGTPGRRSSPSPARRSRRARRCTLIVSAGQPQVDLHQREGHPARQRRQRARSWTRSPTTTRGGDEPDLERGGHARGLRRRRPDHAQGHHQGERGRGAADARPAATTPTSRGRRSPTPTCSPSRRFDGRRTWTCASARSPRDGMDANCIMEPVVLAHRGSIHWAPDGKSILAFAGKNDEQRDRHRALARSSRARTRSRPTRRTGPRGASCPTSSAPARA